MEKIIGGEFSISCSVINTHPVIQKNYFSTGRGAFAAILRTGIKRILLPDYLCSSITQVCIDETVQYSFYHIKETLYPDEEDLLFKINQSNAVLLISYFGMINVENIAKKIKKSYPKVVVIIDDVQNFFSELNNEFYDYRFTSYRKWFAVPDGAEVITKFLDVKIPTRDNSFAQYKFSGNILKNYYDFIDEKICLDLLVKGEEILDNEYDCKCSEISKKLISQINFDDVKKARIQNAVFLHNELEKLGICHIFKENTVPFFVPVFLDNQKEIRAEFFNSRIFTPVHWPYKSKVLNGEVKNLIYDRELSLICDQRYSIDDMERQIKVIRKCI